MGALPAGRDSLTQNTHTSAKMPHSFGMRARTRDMFKRNFKDHGMIKPSTFLKTYKVGDIVDIKANSAQQKGMPHKYYHGRTGVIYNVSKSAVGIIVYKVVGNRYMEKRVNIKVEHVRHSKCRDDFIRRVKENAAAKEKGTQVNVKRLSAQPREARKIEVSNDNAVETLTPLPTTPTSKAAALFLPCCSFTMRVFP